MEPTASHPTFGFHALSFLGPAYPCLHAGAPPSSTPAHYPRALPRRAARHLHLLRSVSPSWTDSSFSCGLIGFAGRPLPGKLEDLQGLREQPWRWLTRWHGLTYLGGLLFGAITYLYILRRKGISLPTAADIGSPGHDARLRHRQAGLHLAGDGDWGILSNTQKPAWLSWAPDWSGRPTIRTMSSARASSSRLQWQLLCGASRGVFPTPLYESLACFILFALLWALRRA